MRVAAIDEESSDLAAQWASVVDHQFQAQSRVHSERAGLVMAHFTSLVSWIPGYVSTSRVMPVMYYLALVNSVHLAAMACSWFVSVLAALLCLIGDKGSARIMARLADGIFTSFSMQARQLNALLLDLL